jgi:hypothetical protein
MIPTPRRCQHNVGTPYQCVYAEGHEAKGLQHINQFEQQQAEYRRHNPTIDDIRKVVREELERLGISPTARGEHE